MNAREGEKWETKKETDNQLGGHWGFYRMPCSEFMEFTCVNPVCLQKSKVASLVLLHDARLHVAPGMFSAEFQSEEKL